MNRAAVVITMLAIVEGGIGAPVQAQQVTATTEKNQHGLYFDILAQPVCDALNKLAAQSRMQVVLYTDVGDGVVSTALSGHFNSVDDALKTLLAHTGLTYAFLNDRTIVVYAVAQTTGRPYGQKYLLASSAALLTQAQDSANHPASTPVPAVESNGEGPGARDSDVLQEVIVTAQKRSEKLMEVPSSLTSLSALSLQNQGVTTFSDYMTLVPSLSDFSEGAQGHGVVILRALNTGYFQFSNTIGYYIDDVPFSATSPLSYGAFLTLDPDLTDIDHLEVLKGPQATLYGASTLGGLIKVVTKRPDLNTDSGEIRMDAATLENGGSGYGLFGAANVVLVPGQLAMRVSGFNRDTPGYMTNLTLDTKDRNSSRKQGGRIGLRWDPSDALDIQLSAFLQSLFVDGWNYEHVNLQTLQPINGPYTYSLPYDSSFHTTYEVYNAAINYKTGSIGTLTNSTSYARYNDLETVDYSLYYGVFNAFAPEPVPSTAAQPLIFGPSLNKFSEELRFTSERLGAFELIAGLFYTKEAIGYVNYLYNAIPPSVQPIPGPSGNILSLLTPASYKEEAGFADLTYYITPALDLTLGGRYSHNQQAVTSCQTGFAVVPGCIPNSSSDSDFTYLAALRWRPTADLNAYARVASSYRPGGPQLTPLAGHPNSFQPDSLVNYEIGLKSDWLDHKLRTSLAVYDMEWKDVQMSSNIEGYSVISNGGKATVRGVELETQFAPIRHLTLGVNVAYTDAKFDSVSADVSAVTGAVAGDKLPFTPAWAASALADYVLPLTDALSSTYGATYRYQGNKWSDYPGNPLNTGVVIPHYDTLDLRAGLNWSRYQVQVRVANVFNSHGIDSVVDQRIAGNPPADAAIIPPRTYALSFAASF